MVIGETVRFKKQTWHKFYPSGSPGDNSFLETLNRDQKTCLPVTGSSALNSSQTAILVDSAGFQAWKAWRDKKIIKI